MSISCWSYSLLVLNFPILKIDLQFFMVMICSEIFAIFAIWILLWIYEEDIAVGIMSCYALDCAMYPCAVHEQSGTTAFPACLITSMKDYPKKRCISTWTTAAILSAIHYFSKLMCSMHPPISSQGNCGEVTCWTFRPKYKKSRFIWLIHRKVVILQADYYRPLR